MSSFRLLADKTVLAWQRANNTTIMPVGDYRVLAYNALGFNTKVITESARISRGGRVPNAVFWFVRAPGDRTIAIFEEGHDALAFAKNQIREIV